MKPTNENQYSILLKWMSFIERAKTADRPSVPAVITMARSPRVYQTDSKSGFEFPNSDPMSSVGGFAIINTPQKQAKMPINSIFRKASWLIK
jgi:hypothetical protein